MSLIREYILECDMCHRQKKLNSVHEKNDWSHQFPVKVNNEIHYELMDLCPTCLASVALTVEDNGDYSRGE